MNYFEPFHLTVSYLMCEGLSLPLRRFQRVTVDTLQLRISSPRYLSGITFIYGLH